jgi:DNA replication factor GINS
MHLDDLRTILLSERETGRLTIIPHDTYDAVREELDELTSEVYANEDPFSERTQVLIQRAASIRETLQDLFRIRAEKILSLAQGHIDSHPSEKDEVKKMLLSEREMFETVTGAISLAREHLVAQLASCSATQGQAGEEEWPIEDAVAGAAAQDERVQAPAQGYVVARVLETMEPFMGVDGRIYHLEKEDVVTLPRRNAEVLNERNIVAIIA